MRSPNWTSYPKAADARPEGKNLDSFGTFLKTVSPQSGATSEAAGAVTQSVPRRILHRLSEERGAAPVSSLMNDLQLGVVELGNALRAIQAAGIAEVRGTGADERVELTDIGRQLASLDW
jgi:hypothetical protein